MSRLVMWCGDAPNQRALANKLHKAFGLSCIILDGKVSVVKRSSKLERLKNIADKLRFFSIYKAWQNMLKQYHAQFPSWPAVPMHKLPNINSTEAFDITQAHQPDLVIVSGTSLIKEPLLSLKPRIGIINLHTGLSPYVKGGPNCTNWCIANGDWHLVGNTIMWLNAGIDTGNIITTENVDIRPAADLTQAQLLVMEHAHDLYLRAVRYLLAAQPPYQSVKQDEIAKGKLYLTRMWDQGARTNLLRNWKKRKNITLQQPPKTIPLPAS